MRRALGSGGSGMACAINVASGVSGARSQKSFSCYMASGHIAGGEGSIPISSLAPPLQAECKRPIIPQAFPMVCRNQRTSSSGPAPE